MESEGTGFRSTPDGKVDHAHNAGELEMQQKSASNGIQSESDDDGMPRRTGNTKTATAYIAAYAATSIGVLCLPWCFAQIGWIAGPIVLLSFGVCTWYTSGLLVDCYRYIDPVTGVRKRNYTYKDAVRINLSARSNLLSRIMQFTDLIGSSLVFMISAVWSAVSIQKSVCYHKNGDDDPCWSPIHFYFAAFGCIQIFLSQIPNFGNSRWTISVWLFAYVIVWTFCIGLGIFEIRGILCPRAVRLWSGQCIILYLNMLLAICGYLAFGDDAPEYLTDGFFRPYWAIVSVDVFIIIVNIVAYQVFTQDVYQSVERLVASKWKRSTFHSKTVMLKLPGKLTPRFEVNWFRLVWRTLYVAVMTIAGILLPYFSGVLGLTGALVFWPLAVYYPVVIYINQYKIPRWSRTWIALHSLSFIAFVVSALGVVGSVASIITELKELKPFQNVKPFHKV